MTRLAAENCDFGEYPHAGKLNSNASAAAAILLYERCASGWPEGRDHTERKGAAWLPKTRKFDSGLTGARMSRRWRGLLLEEILANWRRPGSSLAWRPWSRKARRRQAGRPSGGGGAKGRLCKQARPRPAPR